MNEVQNFANFHTCYLPYGFEFFHKGHPKHKLNYSWPKIAYFINSICKEVSGSKIEFFDDVIAPRNII